MQPNGKFLGYHAKRRAGPKLFGRIPIWLPVKVDNLPYREVKQCIKASFLESIPSRWGSQAPTNTTFNCPRGLKNASIYRRKKIDLTYGERYEMDIINKAFIEVMWRMPTEEDSNIPFLHIPLPKTGRNENNRLLFEMTSNTGHRTSRIMNSDMKPTYPQHVLQAELDLRELRKKTGGYFGSGKHRLHRCVNINFLYRIRKRKRAIHSALDHTMDIAARSLDIKRKVISKLLEKDLYPYTKVYLGTFDNHFSTIGLIGMNEACLNASWIRETIDKPNARKFALEVLQHMKERLLKYQNEYGALFNLEATPAESTTYRLAKHDREIYPDIICAGKKAIRLTTPTAPICR